MIFPTSEGVEPLESGSPATQVHQRSATSPRVPLTIAIIAIVVLGVDQVTKSLVANWLGPGGGTQRRELVGRILALEYVENTGAAFGILAGRAWLLSVLALLIVLWFVGTFRGLVPGSVLLQVAVGLVLGGAIGNLVDRVRLGHVVDFLAVGWWPRFNVADSAITIGLVCLFVSMLREDEGVGGNR